MYFDLPISVSCPVYRNVNDQDSFILVSVIKGCASLLSLSSWWSLGLEDDIVPLSVRSGMAMQADPRLAEPCADWAREVCSCRWNRGC